MPHRRSRVRLALASAALLSLPLVAGAVGYAQTAPSVFAGPVPRAKCGPGSMPETGMQGRINPPDIASGRAAKGYTCNTVQIGHFPSSAGWKVARYGDCAYYNADPGGIPLGALTGSVPGTYVLDVSDPTKPVQTDFLRTAAMGSPHESMAIDKQRGLLVAVLSNLLAAPGVLEVYDVKTDCKHPTLLSSLPSGVLGHEGNFSRDGKTFYTGSLYAQTLAAVDLTDPLLPTLIAVENVQSHGMSTNPDGTRLYDTIRGDDTAGLVIYDTTEIQQRKSGAAFTVISRLTWPEKSTPQFAMHVTIKGKPYVIETDEFGGASSSGSGPIGAARIIDISNEQVPRVVSNLRLEVHMDAGQATTTAEGDTVPLLGGPYTGHYCSVPSYVDPGIVACSMLRSGVRVFDIRDPLRPKELAYFSPPAEHDMVDTEGGNSRLHTGANVEFVPERGEMWLTGIETGFHVVRFTNGVWPFAKTPVKRAAASAAPAPEPAPVTPHPLPATGLPEGLAVAAALVFAGAVTAAATRAERRT